MYFTSLHLCNSVKLVSDCLYCIDMPNVPFQTILQRILCIRANGEHGRCLSSTNNNLLQCAAA